MNMSETEKKIIDVLDQLRPFLISEGEILNLLNTKIILYIYK